MSISFVKPFAKTESCDIGGENIVLSLWLRRLGTYQTCWRLNLRRPLSLWEGKLGG